MPPNARSGRLSDDVLVSVIRWQSAIDFLVLAVGIYLLLQWSREARALRLALSILALRVGALLARQLGLLITGWVLDGATIVVVLALVVVFQPELRRALMRLDLPGRVRQASEIPVVSAVSAAAWSLARARCGALLVIVQKDAIAELVTTGVHLDGRVSVGILEAVFQKGSALHDGAALIEGDLVSRVGAILPLTQRATVPERYGTRHRAGMGLAERSDALVVVVSEERGEVTLMCGDQIRPMPSESDLVAALNALTTKGTGETSRPLRAGAPADVGLPAAALALSAMVWGLTFLLPGASVRVRSVPLEFTHVPDGLTIASQSVDTVEVWLRGSDFIFDSVDLAALVARCDLAAAHEGFNAIQVPSDAFDVPLGLRIDGIAPRQVSVRLSGNTPPPAR
jgi:diadenylate cyclase